MTVEDDRGRRESGRYGAVLIANGHHWDPRWPEPPFPGSDQFLGEQMHVHHYREPDVLRGKRVLVLGIGNSATDIAVESSRDRRRDLPGDAARRLRRSPSTCAGMPTDETGSEALSRLPLALQRRIFLLGAEDGDRRRHLLRPAPARPQAARGPSDRLVGAAAADRPRRHHREAEHRALRGPQRPLRGRQRRGDRPGHLLHRLQDHLPLPRPLAALGPGEPDRPLPQGGLGRAPGPLLHRPDPATGGDHADRRAAVAMGRRPARGKGRAAGCRGDAQGDRADPLEDGAPLRRLKAPHDPGRLPPLHARSCAASAAAAPAAPARSCAIPSCLRRLR